MKAGLTFIMIAILICIICFKYFLPVTTITVNNTQVETTYRGNVSTITYTLKPIGTLEDKVSMIMYNSSINYLLKHVGIKDTSSANLKFFVTIYEDYDEYVKLKLKGSEALLAKLFNSSCRIASKDLIITMSIRKVDEEVFKVSMKLTFIDGVASCGIEFNELPVIDGRWIRANNSFIAKFNTLNVSREIYVNRLSGISSDVKGKLLGHFIFKLGERALREKSALLLYNTWHQPELKLGNSWYPIINLVYVINEGTEFMVKGISIDKLKNMPKGVLLCETKFTGIPLKTANEIIKLLKSREVMNIPPFLKYFVYFENNGTLIRWKLDLSKIPSLCSSKLNLVKVGSMERSLTIYGSNVKEKRTCYGLRIGDKYYIAALSPNVERLVYDRNGMLKRGIISLSSGYLSEALPEVITASFGITDESIVNASKIIIELTNYNTSH